MQLPDDLRAALETELQAASLKAVSAAAHDLSHRYRLRHGRCSESVLRSVTDVSAYAAYRLPATFAALGAVLEEVQHRRPDLHPKSLLDIGAGPGTGAWAATHIWPHLERITLLERDARMITLGRALTPHSHSPAVRHAVWHEVDATGPWACAPADVTMAAYVLGELPVQTHEGFVQQLWQHTLDTCVIVEPGTPRGFDLVRQAGACLVGAEALILAPFPWDWECLESAHDWCHFSERVPRTRLHRAAKNAELSYEDEKYCYVTASRWEGVPIAARVIRQPQVRSGHIRLVLCTPEGVKHLVVARSQGEAYRRAKHLAWGSAIPVEEASLFGLPV